MTAPPLLRLDGLQLSHASDKDPLFTGLSLDIESGRAIVLRGPSGVGKSTLLRCLAGLESRAEGQLHFEGRLVAAKDIPGFRGRAIYVPQSPPRLPMNTEESLRAAFAFRHQSHDYDPDLARSLCKSLLLPLSLLEQPLGDLSGGEAQRFGLLRALLLEPTLLLLDEPASNLDADARAAMAKTLGAWFGKAERSMVVCSHEPSWCEDLLTDSWQLGAGSTLAVGSYPA